MTASRPRIALTMGDVAGIGGAYLAALEGQIAAWHASAVLGKIGDAKYRRHLPPLRAV